MSTTEDFANVGTSHPQPKTDPAGEGSRAADFLRRVVPWPSSGAPGFINLHWTLPDRAGMGGKPFSKLADLLSMVPWCNSHPAIVKDLYFCLSRQSQAGPVVNGKAKVLRNANNATFLKAVWLDIDGNKQPPKGYLSKTDAFDALAKFLADTKLPPPNALVDSGNGWHVYWISDKLLSVEEWREYAAGLWALVQKHGLHADAVTTDAARVLRVPDTFNNKSTPPKPVKLVRVLPDYDFEATLSWIKSVQGPKNPPVTDEEPDCRREGPPIDAYSVIQACPHFMDAIKTGGKDHDQGLWMQTILASTWFNNGRKVAHALSHKHPGYSKEETDAMFDRKVNDREAKGLGWPSCETFQNYGCKLCATCEHFGKIKSPLNLADPAETQLTTRAQDSVTGQVKEEKIHPVMALKALHQRGASRAALFAQLNENYAVVRYGSEIIVAAIIGNEVIAMKAENFHKMFANVRIKVEDDFVEVSRLWFKWQGRRQYLDRGIVFEPGGPSDVAEDMLNLWRGFGIEPKQGDWTLMRNHIFSVVCSQQKELFGYLIGWLACTVQRPNEPIGVAVAFRGAPGAGKGIVARTLGKMFGKHFAHIANGDQLTGRFNASLATSCLVFLDEALWAGDKKGEGVLKALITEPRLQLEAKFRDPIMVDNRLRIIVASNEDWVVPTGMGDRRWFILDVANTFAGTGKQDYWDPIYAEIENGGAAAMFYDLLAVDLSRFDVRAVPHTAAKARQQAHSLRGTDAWLYHVLNEGAIGIESWKKDGLIVTKDHAYACLEDFSKHQRHWRPDVKAVWSKKLRELLGPCMEDARQKNYTQRVRAFKFAPLADCRRQFASHSGAPNIEWEPANEEADYPAPASRAAEHSGEATEPNALDGASELECEPVIEPDDIEWEPVAEPDNRLDSFKSPISDPFQVDQAAADLAPVQRKT